MEINKIMGDVKPVVAVQAIVEGKMVLLTQNTIASYDFGSKVDLAGVKVPSTADEAKRARFMVAFPVTYMTPPIYATPPSFDSAMRGGWDQAANLPFTSEIQTTYPGYQKSKTIPSGSLARAFGAGTYTVYSGQFVASAGIIVPGALVQVEYAAGADQGRLKVATTYDADLVVGVVDAYDTAYCNLTVTLKEF